MELVFGIRSIGSGGRSSIVAFVISEFRVTRGGSSLHHPNTMTAPDMARFNVGAAGAVALVRGGAAARRALTPLDALGLDCASDRMP
jgi:hypothetical protein